MKSSFVILLALALLLPGCACRPPADTLTQTSTIDALLAGGYDGELASGELLRYGDLGIGTFDRLDGEMIVLDGRIYQVKADGRVYRPPGTLSTPFAAVVRFEPDEVVEISQGGDFAAITELLDSRIAEPNLFHAIRIQGRFAGMHTRSVPAQQKPYPPLAEVAEDQPEFVMTDISGTIVGFRCPAYVKGINVPGYHLHFLSDDRRHGGHILDFEIEEGMIEIDRCHRFLLIMPRDPAALQGLDLSRDRSAELEEVEK